MTPQEIEQVVRAILGTTALQYGLFAIVLSAGVSLVASYLGSYTQAKGANRALREDLRTLTEKVAATTKTAEEIRARIGQSTFVEQRQWDLKRELYADLLKAVHRMKNVYDKLEDLHMAEHNYPDGEYHDKLVARSEALEKELPILWDEMNRVRGIGELVLSTETIAAMDRLLDPKLGADEQSHFEFLNVMYGATRKAHVELVASGKKDLDVERRRVESANSI